MTLKTTTRPIEEPVNKTKNKTDFKIRHSSKYNDYSGGLYTNSVETCHKCDKKTDSKLLYIE